MKTELYPIAGTGAIRKLVGGSASAEITK